MAMRSSYGPRRSSNDATTPAEFLSFVDRSITTHGFSFRERHVSARPENPRHEHEYHCAGFILDGLGTAEFSRESWMVGPGNLNVIPRGVTHREQFGSPTVRWCSLELLDPAADVEDLARQAFSRPAQFSRGKACEISRRITAELRTNDNLSPLSLWGLGIELLAAIARREEEASDNNSRWLSKVEEYLRAHCVELLSVRAIAADAGVHPGHLARVFRQARGCTIGEYVRIHRIERAKTLLADRERPIAAIATDVGFNDQAHLTRAFKAVTGTTPAAYRAALHAR